MTRGTPIVRVVVAGALANKVGNGGEAWVRTSWVRALETLGARVDFVERLGPGHSEAARECAVRWFARVTRAAGLDGRAWLLDADDAGGRDPLVGDPDALQRMLPTGDLLVDISGNLTGWAPAEALSRRVHVDLDPGYTQVWAHDGLLDLSWHDLHATVGLDVGTNRCAFPSGGRSWIAIRPPVHLPDWPVTELPSDPRLTTVTSWRGPYGPLEWAGASFGVKAHRFRAIAPLARRAPVPVELAVSIDDADEADRRLLVAEGWQLTEPARVAATPGSFAAYVRGSWGELSIASPVYVEGRTGWFSDRTVRYLASGRPAIVEDTGWSAHLPHGSGLRSFEDVDGALAAIDEVRSDPAAHARAAREVADACFAPRAALAPLLDALGWPA